MKVFSLTVLKMGEVFSVSLGQQAQTCIENDNCFNSFMPHLNVGDLKYILIKTH